MFSIRTRITSEFLRLFVVALLVLTGCSKTVDESADGAGVAGHDEELAGGELDDDHQEGIVDLTPEAAAAAGIRSVAVEERVLNAEIETTGLVDFDQDRMAHVAPRIPGRVLESRARLGDVVTRGEIMVTLDSIELGQAKASFLQSKAQQDLARENFEREKGLFADRISSEREMLVAQAAFQSAEAALKAAEETLHLYGLPQSEVESLHYDDPHAAVYSLRAPFAGKVMEKHTTVGELVTPEDNLFVLADLSRVWVWIDVFEMNLSRVHLQDDVRVRVDAYPDEIFVGRVSYLSDRVDPDTRTVRARIDVPNPGRELRPGMFARIKVSDPHRSEERGMETGLAVPEEALLRDQGNFVVFVLLGEGRFERREVRIGRRAEGYVEVLDGLTLGEEVVIHGAFILKSEASKEELGGGHGH